jgi:hypothetical protein
VVYLSQFTANAQLSGELLEEFVVAMDQLAHLAFGELLEECVITWVAYDFNDCVDD